MISVQSFYLSNYFVQCDKLELYTTSIVRLLEAQPNLCDHVPSLGYIPKLCLQLSSQSNPNVPVAAITILHQLSVNEVIFLFNFFSDDLKKKTLYFPYVVRRHASTAYLKQNVWYPWKRPWISVMKLLASHRKPSVGFSIRRKII